MKKFYYSLLLMIVALVCSISASAASVSITGQGGWFESAYVTWQKTSGLTYNVYVSPASSSNWTLLDDELVREYPTYGRADALGLKEGSYKFKVVPVQNGSEVTGDAAESSAVEVKKHDRSGFAHQKAGSEGIGAYNNDGTLKDDARVVYVWADNAKTVSLDVAKNAKGQTDNYVGLQQIIYGYQKGDANGSYEKRPLCVRIIGTIKDSDMDAFGSSSEGLQIKGQKEYGKMNITIEGVGDDATIWGFGFLIRNASRVELRNFGIMLCMDDCVSIDTKNEMIWVHNVDFFYGKTGGDADQAKGDGALDFKGNTQYCTFSYNHFYDTGKSNLGGLSESSDNFITLHHNWYDHSDSRHPRIRRMSMHIYNNYFDGVSKYGVGMTTGGSAFVENNYFRNCKYPMLISMQGSDIAFGKGTFSSEDGGIIKSFGNVVTGARTLVTYQQNQTEFDCWEASSRSDQVPSNVKCKQGGTSYNNFDQNLYAYTPDAAADVPGIVKGQYGAGRMQHGDFTWTFNNSVQDENYGVINELKSALQSYKSTLVGFFGNETVKNGGATSTVNAGDGKGMTDAQQEYTPTWAGGSGGSVAAGLPDPNFCGAETEAGSKVYDYLWFNSADKTKMDQNISGNLLTYSDGCSFDATREMKSSDGSTKSKYTGSLQIPAGGYATFKCVNGVFSISANIFRTGDAKGQIQVSKNGTSFSKISDYSAKKGDVTISASTIENTGPVYVRITNGSSGALHITGIKIMYPDPENPVEDTDPADDPTPDEPSTPDVSSDATAEFSIGGNTISFSNYAASVALPFDDAATSVTVKVTPADGATVSSATNATAVSDGNYAITAPAAGQAVRATFTIKAEDNSTKTYVITVTKGEDPSTIDIETGSVTLQSDNVPAGFKVDGSSSVTAYTYSSDLCKDANLFKAASGQHTVTIPAGAKVTKIVMYAVGDNNTANKGKITELAGQTFSADLPSRKSGTSFATATVDNVALTGSFTFTVTYAAGVKFAMTVESASGETPDPTPDDPTPGPTPTDPTEKVDVTASQTWDWSTVAGSAVEMTVDAGNRDQDILLSTAPGFVATSGFLANALIINGQYAWREANGSKFTQVNSVKFNTTVPGNVVVEYANTGNNAARTVTVNGTKDSGSSASNSSYSTSAAIDVAAGEVVIAGQEVETGDAKMLRIRKIVFTATGTAPDPTPDPDDPDPTPGPTPDDPDPTPGPTPDDPTPDNDNLYDWSGKVGTTTIATAGQADGVAESTVKVNNVSVNCIKFGKSAGYADTEKTVINDFYVAIKPASGTFKAGDVIHITGCINNKDTETKKGAITVYSSLQEAGKVATTEDFVNTYDTSVTPVEQTITLPTDCETIILTRSGNTATCITALTVVRGEDSGETSIILTEAAEAQKPVKRIENGHLIIVIGDDKFNASGSRVE